MYLWVGGFPDRGFEILGKSLARDVNGYTPCLLAGDVPRNDNAIYSSTLTHNIGGSCPIRASGPYSS